MRTFFNLGIILLLLFICSCQQETSDYQNKTVSADTSNAALKTQEETLGTDIVELNYAELKGKRLFEHYCTICHGEKGKGDGFNAYNLHPKPKDITEKGYLDSLTNDWLKQAVGLGGRGVKRSVQMPAYASTLNDQQITDIVTYLRYLSRN